MDNIVNDFYSSTPGIKRIERAKTVKLTFTYETEILIPEYADYDNVIDNFISDLEIDISDCDISERVISNDNYYIL